MTEKKLIRVVRDKQEGHKCFDCGLQGSRYGGLVTCTDMFDSISKEHKLESCTSSPAGKEVVFKWEVTE